MTMTSYGARALRLARALIVASSTLPLLPALPALAAGTVGVKLYDQSSDGRHYALYVGVGPTAASVVLCEGVGVDRCDASTAGAQRTRLVATRADRKIFLTEYSLDLREGVQYAVVGLDAAGQKTDTQAIKLTAASPNGGGNPPPGNPPPTDPNRIKLEALSFAIPSGWKVHQDAAARGMLIVGLTNGTDYLRLYVKQGGGFDMQKVFVNGSTVTKAAYTAQHAGRTWQKMETKKGNVNVACFTLELDGKTYWGFATSKSSPAAIVDSFLESTR